MASTNHNEGDSSESDNGLFQQMEMQNYVTNGGMPQPVVQSNNIKMVTNAQSLPTNVIPQPSPISPSSSQAVLMTGVAIGDQLNKGTTTNTAQITPKMYCIVGYRILLHILLLYAVVISTYLLLTRNDNCQCNQDTQSELNIIDLTTELPTQSPPILESTSSTTTTIEPTLIPSKSPTLLPSPYVHARCIILDL